MFGYDDDLSRDHDWNTGFCLWLEEDDFDRIGLRMHNAYEELIRRKSGQIPKHQPGRFVPSRGVFPISPFSNGSSTVRLARKQLGMAETARGVPGRLYQRQRFFDPLGAFSISENHLLDYYPEDIRLKKIAARCFSRPRTVSTIFPDPLQRKDPVAPTMRLPDSSMPPVSLAYLL
jgi:hypothetical protein